MNSQATNFRNQKKDSFVSEYTSNKSFSLSREIVLSINVPGWSNASVFLDAIYLSDLLGLCLNEQPLYYNSL